MNQVPLFASKALVDYTKDKTEKKAAVEHTAKAELDRIKRWQTGRGIDTSKPLPTEKPLPPLPHEYTRHAKTPKRKKRFRFWKKKKRESVDVDFSQFLDSPVEGPSFIEGGREHNNQELTALPPVSIKRFEPSAVGLSSASRVGTAAGSIVADSEALKLGVNASPKDSVIASDTVVSWIKEEEEMEAKKKPRARKRLVKKVRKDGETQSLW